MRKSPSIVYFHRVGVVATIEYGLILCLQALSTVLSLAGGVPSASLQQRQAPVVLCVAKNVVEQREQADSLVLHTQPSAILGLPNVSPTLLRPLLLLTASARCSAIGV
jgi:hypothetical protein